MSNELSQCVYIFRGVPGSGKSRQASQLAIQAQTKGHSVRYCSEEFFFVGSDGKFRFDQGRVEAARLSCQASLKQALDDGVQLVCVDDILATQASYAPLVRLATAQNYEVKVVEMPCPDVLNLQRFFARSRKTTPGEGYSYDYVASLWSLWEPHSEQLLQSANDFRSMSFEPPTHEFPPISQPPAPYYFRSHPFTQPNHSQPSPKCNTEELSIPLPGKDRNLLDQSHPSSQPPRHAKKEELLHQLYHLKQQEIVLQQQLKQQKLCDQLSSRPLPRRFSQRQEGVTTVVLAPYTAPTRSNSTNAFSRSKQPSFSNFSFPLLEKY